MRTSSLDIQEDKNKEDLDNRILKLQMDDANKAIKSLTMELSELQKLVRENLLICKNSLPIIHISGNRFSSTKTSNEFSAKSINTNTIECIKSKRC